MTASYTVLEPLKEDSLFLREFAADVSSGLCAPLKKLHCKYIYDHHGSRLFSEIMDLPEYYLTRSELEVLETHKDDICRRAGGCGLDVVELGAGDGRKTRVLLGHLMDRGERFNYVPIDISESAVRGLSRELSESFPHLEAQGLVAEYMRGMDWLSRQSGLRKLVLFLGSSIGNFPPPEAMGFLKALRGSLRPGDLLLTGFDLQKDVKVMAEAYDDSRGLTASFNLNLLRRINRELGGEFDLGRFDFHSAWDPASRAVQSYLITDSAHEVWISELDRSFGFEKWEPIHTESSRKFSLHEVRAMAEEAGFEVDKEYLDSRRYFVDSLWKAA